MAPRALFGHRCGLSPGKRAKPRTESHFNESHFNESRFNESRFNESRFNDLVLSETARRALPEEACRHANAHPRRKQQDGQAQLGQITVK